MEETEIPTEHLQEEMHHLAESSKNRMNTWIAFSSAVLAALAAVTSLLSGHHANEAMLDQIRASNSWNYYQAKGIKSLIVTDATQKEEYKKEQTEIKTQAEEQTASSFQHLEVHNVLASGVTFFQVAISIAAIAALTRKKKAWWVSLGFGTAGLFFLLKALFFTR